jgi:outer membrane scaffolding protein for murein synthesis (MipA/OmpV family)
MGPLRRALIGALFLAALSFASDPSLAQTPSPLAAWQYSVGEVLTPLGGPVPEWRFTFGGGVNVQPFYDGSKRYRIEPSFVVDIRYRELLFLSDGEGLGINILHGQNYRAGVALGYDLGRDHHLQERLAGLGNVAVAPEAKIFAEYFLLPVVISADLRKGFGGHNGVIGDLGAYVPIPVAPGLYVFTGPSVTVANERYLQAYFGVTAAQAANSGFPVFTPHGGFVRTGWGVTTAYQWTEHWWLEAQGAVQYILGDAGRSPITEDRAEMTVGANVLYRF